MEGGTEIDTSCRALLLLIAVLTGGCCFPYAHTTQDYSSDVPFPTISVPDRTPELEPYFVGDAFVKSRVFEDDDYERGAPLFHFLVSVEHGAQNIDQVVVHGLHIRIDGSEVTGVVIHDSSQTQQTSLPLTESFAIGPYARSDGYYFFSETIEAEVADFRSVTLIVDIEVGFPDGAERKTVVHEFQREIAKRILSCVEV